MFALGGESQAPDFFINGQIRIGSGGLAPVAGLRASLEPGGNGIGAQVGDPVPDVLLRWRNEAPYELIRIERNGTAIAELSGHATEYRDVDVPPSVLTYKVLAVAGGATSFPSSAFLSTFSPPGAFIRGDANRDRTLDLSDALATLAFLFLDGGSLPCEDAADFDDNGYLDLSDPIGTLGFLFLGRGAPRPPGITYPWFDPTPDGLSCRD